MNLEQMLHEALQNIDSMSADDFKAECIKAGYTPVKKHVFDMSDKNEVEVKDVSISYGFRGGLTLIGFNSVDFTLEPANESPFQIAA